MLTLYLNTITAKWYDGNGNSFRNGSPALSIKSRETIKIICVTDSDDADTEGCNPSLWTRDTHYASLQSVGAVITCDSDYQHYIQGKLASAVEVGAQTTIQTTISGATLGKIKSSGTIRLFNTAGQYDALTYTSRSVSGDTVTFDVTGASTTRSYPVNSSIDCDQSPYCESFMDGSLSNVSRGEFGFVLIADGARIREECDYANKSKLIIAGLEFLPYYIDGDNNTIRLPKYLCDTFSLVGVQGNPDSEGELPESIENQIASVIDSKIGGDVSVSTSVVGGTTYANLVLAGVGGTSNAFVLPKGDAGDSAYATVAKSGTVATITCGVVGGTSTTATVLDGVDSSATVVKSGSVATITCTTGTVSTTATVLDGIDSSATVVKSGSVATITCTTGGTTTTATVLDGRNGTDASAIVVKSGTVSTITCMTGGTTTTATVLDGAIVTGAGEIYIYIESEDEAVCENTVTGGTESVQIYSEGGTSCLYLPLDFLGVDGKCEYDVCDASRINISSKVVRGWEDDNDEYIISFPSVVQVGDEYYAKPCGIRGEDGTVQVRAGTGTTVSQSGGTARVSVDFTEVQKKIVEGTNISISADGKTISATDTTYTAGSGLSLNGTQFSLDTSALVYGGTASLAGDHTALLGKQDQLTSANAGDNVTIAEVGGVMKISSNGTTYTSSDSIEFTGGTSPTANVRISDSENSPLSIESGTGKGLKLNVSDYFYVANGELNIHVLASVQGDSVAQTLWGDYEFCAEVMKKMRDEVLSNPNDYLYTAGDNVRINGSTISANGVSTIRTVGGTSLVVSPGDVLAWNLTENSTMSANGTDGYYGEAKVRIYTGNKSITFNGINVMDALVPNAMNFCELHFIGTAVNLHVNSELYGEVVTVSGGTDSGSLYNAINNTTSEFVTFSPLIHEYNLDGGTIGRNVNLIGNGAANTIVGTSGGTMSVASNKTLTASQVTLNGVSVSSGGTLSCDYGVLDGTIDNYGTINLADTAEVNGSLTMHNGSQMPLPNILSGSGSITYESVTNILVDGLTISGLTITSATFFAQSGTLVIKKAKLYKGSSTYPIRIRHGNVEITETVKIEMAIFIDADYSGIITLKADCVLDVSEIASVAAITAPAGSLRLIVEDGAKIIPKNGTEAIALTAGTFSKLNRDGILS